MGWEDTIKPIESKKETKKTDSWEDSITPIKSKPKEDVLTAPTLKEFFDTTKDAAVGASEGASMGTLPAIIAAGKQIASVGSDEQPGQPSSFKQHLRSAQEPFKEAEERSPVAYNLSKVGGGLVTGTKTGLFDLPRKLGTAVGGVAGIGTEIAAEAGLGAAQDLVSGGNGLTGAAVGAAVPVATRAAQGLAKGGGKVVEYMTKKLAPLKAKEAVETFTKNPELYTEAQLAGGKLDEIGDKIKESKANFETSTNKLKQQLPEQAAQAERTLQNTIEAEKARASDIYEHIKQNAKKSTNLVEIPQLATAENIRSQFENFAKNPTLAPVKNDLQEIIAKVGIDSGDGIVRSPRDFYVDDSTAEPQIVARFKNFTTGDNLNMSVDFRRKLDEIIQKYPANSQFAEEREINQKLQQLRKMVNAQIRNAHDFEPSAHKLLNEVDKQYAKYSKAKEALDTHFKAADTGKMDADKLLNKSTVISPNREQHIQQALQDIDQGQLLEPLRKTQKQLADEQTAQNLFESQQEELKNPLQKLQRLEGTLSGPSDDLSQKFRKFGTRTGIEISHAAPKVGQAIAEGKPTQILQSGVRATNPMISEAHTTESQNSEINKALKDQPIAANWVKQVNKLTKSEVSDEAIKSAVRQAKLNEQDSAALYTRIKDILIKLGKTITP